MSGGELVKGPWRKWGLSSVGHKSGPLLGHAHGMDILAERTEMGKQRTITTGLMGCLLAAATLVPTALLTTPAGATGAYPGETLRLVQEAAAVQGHETNWVASGQQAQVNDYAGGFNLEVFAKDTNVDSSCSPSYLGEEQAELGDETHELQIVIGIWQGPGTTFSVPFKYIFPTRGKMILCAYSVYITDTAAATSLVVGVSPASSPATTEPVIPAAVKPVNTALPSISQSGKTLTCIRGSWRNAVSFAYAWLVNGKLRPTATDETVAVMSALKGHDVICRVTAYNSVWDTPASTRSFLVH